MFINGQTVNTTLCIYCHQHNFPANLSLESGQCLAQPHTHYEPHNSNATIGVRIVRSAVDFEGKLDTEQKVWLLQDRTIVQNDALEPFEQCHGMTGGLYLYS